MTFSHERKIWYRDYPMFTQWALKWGNLFLPKISDDGETDYDLTSKVYILMKNLHQDYKTIMLMDSDERDTYFNMELQYLKSKEKAMKNEL